VPDDEVVRALYQAWLMPQRGQPTEVVTSALKA
jgi:hypothetical protein